MIQSILLVVIVISTIILITYHDDVQISLSEVEICDKRITECYRGVAIILIVLQHCAGELGTNVFTPLGGIGVAMFLFLSGFGLTESFKKKGMGGFLKSKLWRVWMPFFLFYIGIYLLYDNYDCKIFLLNVCSIRQDSYWYVHYMLRCYFIFWIAFNFCYTYRWYLLGTFAIYTFFLYGWYQGRAMFEFSNRCTFIREERLAYFSIKNKKCAGVGIVVYYWDNFISTQAIAGGKKSFGYPLLLFSRIGDKITFRNSSNDYSLAVAS